jgi:hypothetical protein
MAFPDDRKDSTTSAEPDFFLDKPTIRRYFAILPRFAGSKGSNQLESFQRIRRNNGWIVGEQLCYRRTVAFGSGEEHRYRAK